MNRLSALSRLPLLLWSLLLAAPAAADNQERVCARLLALAEANPRLELEEAEHEHSGTRFVQGFFRVPENRVTQVGRELRIGFVVLPARAEEPKPDPVFLLHGGPGAHATSFFQREVNGWLRESRDVVLIDQRGTGSSNKLKVVLPGSDADLQGYFESYLPVEAYAAALPGLQARADLSQYTTPNSVDDFDELRAALGYGQINLRGGSYGTRAALVYLRRHPDSIRTATLNGVQPLAYRNPLPHARGAQEALDLIFAEVQANPRYRRAFPELEQHFWETLERLEDEPARVTVAHPRRTGAPAEVTLDRNAFAEAVRLQLYTLPSNRRLPLLLQRAHRGDYRELAEAALTLSRSVRGLIAWGMLICVTESEDLWRIDPDEIEAACAGTFLGEIRIREQLAVAAIWPSGRVDESFAEPSSVEVPVLLLSGTHDPSTSPRWGAEAARHLPNSLHVVVPGGHGVAGPELRRLQQAFLARGSVKGLDVSEVERLKLPPFVLPEADEVYASPDAPPGGDGSRARPFASLEEARDHLRTRAARGEDDAGADGTPTPTLTLQGGTWQRSASLSLDARDAGLVLRAERGAAPRLVGGVVLERPRLEPLVDPVLSARLPSDAARAAVRVVALPEDAVLSGPVHRGMGSPTVPIGSEVFVDGVALTRARWPNAGFARVGEVLDKGSVPRQRAEDVAPELRETGPERGGVFRPLGATPEQLARWATAEDGWAFGYWFHDWADEQLPIERVDVDAGTLQLGRPHRYGLKAGTSFYVTNLLEELDAPGEYFLDRSGHRLVFWPPEHREEGHGTIRELTVSTLGAPLLRLQAASGVHVEGLGFEATRGSAIVVEDGEDVVIERCRIANTGADAVRIDGVRCAVRGSDLRGIGGTGVSLKGGDRATLTPARNRLLRTRIHDFGRVYRTYRPGVAVSGVGQIVSGNELAHAPHSAIIFGGNEHEFCGNEIYDVLRETGDSGAIYCGRDWTLHGTRIARNFIHHLGGTEGRWQNAIYLDDMASGIEVAENVIWRCHWGMLVGGGRDLRIHDNTFIECDLGIRFDTRGVGWMAKHIADPETSTLHRRLAAMPLAAEPWASRYPSLAGYLDDRFGRPAGSSVTGNRFYATPFGSVVDRECVRVASNSEHAEVPAGLLADAYAETGVRQGATRHVRTGELTDWDLVAFGQSAWTIVVPDEATATEELAAAELARLIEALSGAQLPCVPEGEAPANHRIWLGATCAARELGVEREGLGEDGFVIRTVARPDGIRDLALVPGVPEGGPHGALGALYAVYHLCETAFGCRYWAPGALELPRSDLLTFPADLDLREVPRIWFRQVNYGPANQLDYRRWHKLDRIQQEVGRLWAPHWVHSAFGYVSPEEYYEAHPEYFSLVGDTRTPSQLCLTNPDVFELTKAGVERVFTEHPHVRYLSFSQEDNHEACTCGPCAALDAREGTQMGSLLTFVNALADAFPDRIISTLAYQYSRKPPRTLRPRENVSIMLCTIEEDRARPIASNPASSFPADLEGWCALTDDIFLWDYEVQFASPVAPFPNLRVLQPNVRWFAEAGVRHVFLQGNGLHTELAELRCYLLAKLAWDTGLDVEATTLEFLRGYYGPAAPQLGAYIELLHDELEASGDELTLYGNPALAARSWLRPEVLARAKELFDEAAEAVADSPAHAARLRTARLPLMYAELEIKRRRGGQPGGIWVHEDGDWRPRAYIARLVDEFLAGCAAADIDKLREYDLTPDVYRAQWEALLDPALPGHRAFGRPVEATPPPSAKYAGGDVRRLVDGLPGGDGYAENWIGWEGVDASILLQLGEHDVAPVQLSFSALQDPKSWVWLPHAIDVETSAGGETWRRVAHYDSDPPDRRPWTRRYVVPLSAEEGGASQPITHVRLRVDALETCPGWHIGAGEPAWFFLDELRVE